jgi:RNA polymerase sigma factor (sigma-70 family)
VNDQADSQLLRAYAEHRSEPAFTELVRRHVDFVYSAALRMVCDSHLAQDVTQGVFVALANNATQLTDRLVLSGWLHRTAQNIAAQTVRTDVRRRAREQEAAAMNELFATETDASWKQIAPHLDAALGELNDADRDAIMLRYFEKKSAPEMAGILGISDAAAQKRVSRAVERLREFFSKRNVTIGASGLVVVISANAVQAAPVGLAATISATAVLAGTAVHTSTVIAATKAIAMTTFQKTLITATLAVVAGAGIYEARQAAQLREQNQTLQQLQAPLAEQLTRLQTENERLSNQVVQARDSQALSKAQFNELLKLRGQVAPAQANARELAKVKSTLAQQTSTMPDYLTNSMAMGMEIGKKLLVKDAQARLARMKKILSLTDDQEQAISNIMQTHIQTQTQITKELMSGKVSPETQQSLVKDTMNQEAEIKALFTPEQLAADPEYQQAEKLAAVDNSAKNEASRIADDFNLSQEQQEQIHASFYQMNLNEQARQNNFLNQEAISAAKKSGQAPDFTNLAIELQKSQLEEKIKILGSFLTPEQINTYREEQINQINMGAQMMKVFLPQKATGTSN